MNTTLVTFVGALLAFGAAGCGSDSTAGTPGTTGPTGKAYEEILGYDWKIDPGVETYYCVYKTLKEDLWFSDFRQNATTGTHHVTLGYGDPGPADGTYSETTDPSANPKCNGLTLGTNLAFGATRGTDEFSMPDGVAARIPAGKQLLLSVHVLNASTSPLSGHTGIEAVHADPTKVVHEAEIIFANNVFLTIPPGESVQTGTCTLDTDSTLFAVLGHMHVTGKHLTSTALPASGSPITLVDENYQFDQQKYVMLDPPVALKQGDKIQTTCTYQNPGPDTLTFGESTTKNEMCISITYRYPRAAANFNCFK